MRRLLVVLMMMLLTQASAVGQPVPFGPIQPYLGGSQLAVSTNTVLTGLSPSLVQVTTGSADVTITLSPTSQCIGKTFLVTFAGTSGAGHVIVTTSGSDVLLGASGTPSITLTTVGQQIGITGDGIISWSAFAPDVLGPSRGGTGVTAVGAAGNFLRSNGTTWQSSAILMNDLPASGVAAGFYTSANVTVNAQGIITSIANGSGGGGGGIATVGNLSPVFTSNVNGSALTFALTNAAGPSWFGNATGSTGPPAYNTGAIPNVLVNWGAPGAIGSNTASTGAFTSVSIPNSGFNNQIVSGTLSGNQSCTLPNAASNPVQPLSGATSHQWLTYIDGTGTQHQLQPAFTDISGTLTAAQEPSTTVNSTGNLSPLFNAGINAQALSFTLSNAAADSWFGNATGSSTTPSFNTSLIPNVLINWTSPSAIGTGTPAAGTFTQTNISNSGFNNQIVSATLSGSQTCTLPAANSNPIQPLSTSSGQFVQYIDSAGVQHLATPSGSGTINSGTLGQLAWYAATGTTLSGNPSVTVSNGAVAFGQSGSVAGSLQLFGGTSGSVTMSVPSVAGTGTTFTLPAANSNPIQPLGSQTSNSWVAYIDSSGTQHVVQPAFSNLSGSATSGQLPGTLVYNNQTNTYSTGTQDMSAAAAFRVPIIADPTSSAGSLWVKSTSPFLLKYWDDAGTPVKHTLAIIDANNSFSADQSPSAAGGNNLGTAALPWNSLFVGGAATNNNQIVSATTTAARVCTLPDAASNTIQPLATSSGQFVQYIDSAGVQHLGTPSGAGTVNSGTLGQLAWYAATGTAVSGNANFTISSGAAALGQSATTAGSLQLFGATSGSVNIVVPSVAGTGTTCTLPAANSNTIRPLSSQTSHQWVAYIDSTGVQNTTQPAFTDISGAATSGQLPGTLVYNNQSNTYSTGTQDMSAAAAFRLPIIADPSSSAGSLWVNSTSPFLLKFWDNAGTPVKHTVAIIDANNQFSADQSPSAAAGNNLGTAALPWGGLFVGGAATNNNEIVSATTTAARVCTLPDAASNTIQPLTTSSGQFVQYIDSAGVQHLATPSGSGTINSGTLGQLAWYGATGTTLSGNANFTISSGAAALGQSATTAGSLQLFGAASGSVTISTAAVAGSGTTFILPAVNSNSIQPLSSATSHQWVQYVDSSGVQHLSQPNFTDLLGTIASAQLASSLAIPGSPTTTTQSAGDNTTAIATDQFVTTAVSNAIAAVNPAVAVTVATTGVLPNSPTYNNGVSGVGATLTAGSNTTLTVDGTTSPGSVLVKNQASAFQNGVYTLTTTGSGAAPWVLTRPDYNQLSDINNTGIVPVVSGTANTDTSWLLTSTVTTVGTDSLTYTQFSVNPSTICIGPQSGSANQFVTGANSSGVFTFAQPAFSNLSGSATLGQLPSSVVASVGNLSPLFTTSVSSQALSFSLSNAAANSWFGNATGSSAAPSFNTSVIPNSLINWASSSAIGGTTAAAGTFTGLTLNGSSSGSSSINAPATGGSPIILPATGTADMFLQLTNASTGATAWATPSGGGGTPPLLQQGRIYTNTGAPGADSSSSGVTTFYFGPSSGNGITLYNGSTEVQQTFAEVSLATSGLTASTTYSVYVTSSSSTAVTLSTVAWTNATTPPTAAFQDGREVENGTPGALYVGDIYLDGSKKIYNYSGCRSLYNAYNRISTGLFSTANSGYAYSTSTVRVANAASFTSYGTQAVGFLLGRSTGDSFTLRNYDHITDTGGGSNVACIGFLIDNTTNGLLSYTINTQSTSNPVSVVCELNSIAGSVTDVVLTGGTSGYNTVPTTGFHNYARGEYSQGTSSSFAQGGSLL